MEIITKAQARKGFLRLLSLFNQLTQAVSEDLDAMQGQIDAVSGGSDSGPVAFSVNEAGHLILHYTGDDAPNYTINSDGHLILTL